MPNESGNPPVLHKKHVARLERERRQGRLILYAFIGILAVTVLLVGYGILDQTYFRLSQPVARVDDKKIILKDFVARVKLQRQQFLGQYNQLVSIYNQYEQFAQATGMDLSQQMQQLVAQAQQIQSALDEPETIGDMVLQQMINEEVIRREAAQRGITVSKEELDESLAGFFRYYPNGTPTASPTPTQFLTPTIPAEAFTVVTITPTPLPAPEFTATPEIAIPTSEEAQPTVTLPEETATIVPSATPTITTDPVIEPTQTPTSTPEPTATPYTREAFDKNYSTEVDGMKKLGVTESVYRSLFEIQILERKLKDAVTSDVSTLDQQVWARHILVADETAAKVVIERLQNGEDFATLAMSLSTDTGSAMNGGDLGWFGKGKMVDEFEAAAYALEKPGDFTTEPVKSQFGYHIIQLIAKQDRPLTSDEYETMRDQAFRTWLESAKSNYQIETFDVWQEYVPSEPNFNTMATEAADAQRTAIAEEREAKKEATATP